MMIATDLQNLGFSEKETKVYLALLEYGTQPASIIAKKVSYPKSTVLFLFDNLLKQGFINKSMRGRIQYFYADPENFEIVYKSMIENKTKTLNQIIPDLKKLKHPLTSEPKLTFFEGINGCQKAYNSLLENDAEILEFGAHLDLVEKLGKDFMKNFINERKKKKIYLQAISENNQVHKALQKLDKKQLRKIKLYDKKLGHIYSSIAIKENKVLLLNLYQDPFAIIIENTQVAETLKTIFYILDNHL